MTSIFISYRSSDSDLVGSLFDALSASFGNDEVILDKHTFIPGADWLQQIRSNVAAADCLVFAMGPSWSDLASKTRDSTIPDYVVEELTLARSLGKPILPVLLGISAKDLTENVPKELAWINRLHFVRWQFHEDSNNELISAVSNLSGTQPSSIYEAEKNHAIEIGVLLRAAVGRTLSSLVRPVLSRWGLNCGVLAAIGAHLEEHRPPKKPTASAFDAFSGTLMPR